MSTHAEAVSEFFAAINRDDLAAVAGLLDPEIVRIEPEGFPSSGTYRGVADVQAHVARGRGTWAEGACEPERIFERGDKVVADVRVRVRLKGATEWIDARIADGFVFRGDRIVEFRTFLHRADALRWAGVEEQGLA